MADDEDEVLPPGGLEVDRDAPWHAWHPLGITERLRGVDVPWCVAGGWAMDLFRGGATREHEDLEIAVPIGRFDAIRAALADLARRAAVRARSPESVRRSSALHLFTATGDLGDPECGVRRRASPPLVNSMIMRRIRLVWSRLPLMIMVWGATDGAP
jgi:hypothetical protein